MRMSTYLVTGAAGFIGFHVCKRLLEKGHRVIGIDAINDYYDPNLKLDRLAELGFFSHEVTSFGTPVHSSTYSKGIFIRLSLENHEGILDLFRSYSFDGVVHLAAQAGVRYSIDHPFAYTESNITGFLSILEACRHTKVPHLVYASSSSVYGLNSTYPFSVHQGVDHPISLYAATKRANELMAHTYSHLYGLPTTGLRFFTVYGPWGRPDMAYFTFTKAILQGEPINVYNHGDMYRDFTYIDDVVEGVLLVIDRPPQGVALSDESSSLEKEGTPTGSFNPPSFHVQDPATSSAPFRLYNIGNSNPERLSNFIGILEGILGKKAHTCYLPLQKGDVYATAADISDFERDTGWKPNTSLEKGLALFCQWFLWYYHEVRHS
ncbi:MAG: NAD-dependent epimerase [Treponemataceae bacterium]|nr:NAD-dependent epimerase [Treponemataceae bacterium]